MKKCGCSAFLYATSFFAYCDTISIIDTPYEENTSHQYFVDLVSFIIEKARPEFPHADIELYYEENNTHERTLNLIRSGMLDLSWAGTTKKLEDTLRPIRIPLLGGLLGYRVSIIRKEDKAKFINANEEQIKNMVACQGAVWGDSDILEDNGFSVMRISRFDLMFKMLARGRCDYFPRAIFEGYEEVKAARVKYPELIVLDDVLLHYRFPLYFFVANKNTTLAEQLTLGLNKAIEDGSFRTFIREHPLTKHVFPLYKWQSKRVITLENRFLPDETPLLKDDYWIDLN
ncbi:hypothetical protein [Thalassotalea sediminis]|uniref:hypothetical protein n=1 Tax=Thalassotalea sediminis TaxID=1759089 RepID=UPI002573A628|nr:hypothetical protein [Thalassotalea sediminis]